MHPNYKLINYQDKLYYIYRKVYEDHVKEGMINDLKEYWLCDLVLKNKKDDRNILLFLREISDAIIVE